DPSVRFPGHGRRPKDRSRPSRVVDVVRLKKETRLALQGLQDKILLGKDRRDQAMCVLGPREGRRVVLDQATRIKARSRPHSSKLREGRRRRVLRMKHDGATEFS